MRKVISILFIFVCLFVLSGCSTIINEDKATEITKVFLEARESLHVLDTIIDIDSPIVESISDYSPENKDVWKVIYETSLDGLLGPIIIYVDKYTGDVVGTELRL